MLLMLLVSRPNSSTMPLATSAGAHAQPHAHACQPVRPPAREPGKPAARTANLRTRAEFTDFRLTLEVSVPARSNSGVYLRGLYEVQVADSHGKALDSHKMGAIYSRLTPAVAAEPVAADSATPVTTASESEYLSCSGAPE